ncbi:uncharacterized protein DUF4349 [Asanoa ferruginea]|uniref:Uncharacterized protein DUF4349 n=1 Tax=Asanoa ferruginea TaxID=53367 RepID=A0A3D9ZIF3_9ACTN|nr:DUF4349 domain-containing protein [Asanoa ferruginea]REF97007.1 uncharacterized protein DUF4349 [Asanoa ferruginea]GIF50197.1 hypothetical protein Afe04nite_47360 [Asanoa ferruginea]
MGSVRRRRALTALAAGGLVAALALAGCGSNDDAGSTASAPMSDAGGNGADAQKAAEGAPQAPQEQAQAQGGAGGVELAVDQRQIIYTGSITIRVENVERTAAEVTSMATGAGGFVGGDKRTDDGGRSEAVLTLRVPASRFTAMVDDIADKGTDDRRSISTEDVTEDVVDLDARITTQQARVASARRLLAQAKTINDLVTLENELGKREADLASLEGKKRRLDDLTALSTITVTLLGPDAQAPAPPKSDDTGFLAGLRGGWHAFTATVGVMLTVLGALVPWLVLAGLGLLVFGYVRRLRRGRPAVALAGPGLPAARVAPPTVPTQPAPADEPAREEKA